MWERNPREEGGKRGEEGLWVLGMLEMPIAAVSSIRP